MVVRKIQNTTEVIPEVNAALNSSTTVSTIHERVEQAAKVCLQTAEDFDTFKSNIRTIKNHYTHEKGVSRRKETKQVIDKIEKIAKTLLFATEKTTYSATETKKLLHTIADNKDYIEHNLTDTQFAKIKSILGKLHTTAAKYNTKVKRTWRRFFPWLSINSSLLSLSLTNYGFVDRILAKIEFPQEAPQDDDWIAVLQSCESLDRETFTLYLNNLDTLMKNDGLLNVHLLMLLIEKAENIDETQLQNILDKISTLNSEPSKIKLLKLLFAKDITFNPQACEEITKIIFSLSLVHYNSPTKIRHDLLIALLHRTSIVISQANVLFIMEQASKLESSSELWQLLLSSKIEGLQDSFFFLLVSKIHSIDINWSEKLLLLKILLNNLPVEILQEKDFFSTVRELAIAFNRDLSLYIESELINYFKQRLEDSDKSH